MAGKNGKSREHRHEWQQVAATLQMGKGGRVVGVQVRWGCAVRKCHAETVTTAAIRKPAANAKPTGENIPMSRGEVKAAVDRARQQRRESGTGSLAAMAEYAAEELLAEEFERPVPAESKRVGNAEERRNAVEFLTPQAITLTRELRAAYRRADQHGEDPGCQPADFYMDAQERLYTEAVHYREVSGVEWLGGEDADLMMYADGSVAAFIAAVHPSEGGVCAITKREHIKAAKALLNVEPIDCPQCGHSDGARVGHLCGV